MQDKLVALVTGANQGIGLQIAKDLAAHGLTVLVGSRSLENGETAAKSIGADAHAVQLDVTDQASVAAAAERIRTEFGRLDVLVNNAGISHAGKMTDQFPASAQSGLLTDASLDDVRAVFETNVFGIIAVTQAMLPLLRAAHRHRGEYGRLAHMELGPDERAPRDVRHLLLVEDGGPRGHARLCLRPRIGGHQGQYRLPRLHLDGPQQLRRHPHRRAGRP